MEKLSTHPYTKNTWAGSTLLSVWADCGPHFRAYEFAQASLKEVPLLYKKKIGLNFHGEGHGKTYIDGHGGQGKQGVEAGSGSREQSKLSSQPKETAQRPREKARRDDASSWGRRLSRGTAYTQDYL